MILQRLFKDQNNNPDSASIKVSGKTPVDLQRCKVSSKAHSTACYKVYYLITFHGKNREEKGTLGAV